MRTSHKTFVILFIVVIAAVGLLGYRNFRQALTGARGEVPCNNPATSDPPQLHIHPRLKMVVNGADYDIPQNIGISASCHRVLHTHDDSLKDNFRLIHIEPDFAQEFTLGDFFSVWRKPFSSSTIAEYSREAGGNITMTVNGEPNDDFERLILKDGQRIVIEYKK